MKYWKFPAVSVFVILFEFLAPGCHTRENLTKKTKPSSPTTEWPSPPRPRTQSKNLGVLTALLGSPWGSGTIIRLHPLKGTGPFIPLTALGTVNVRIRMVSGGNASDSHRRRSMAAPRIFLVAPGKFRPLHLCHRSWNHLGWNRGPECRLVSTISDNNGSRIGASTKRQLRRKSMATTFSIVT